MLHPYRRKFNLLVALIAAAVLSVGCVRLTPDATPLSLVSPSATPLPTPTLVLSPTQSPPAEAAPAKNPIPPCGEMEGTVETGEYRGVAVAQEVPFLVYLPPCYALGDELYPTLYLLHGYPFDQRHWQNLGAVEAADRGIGTQGWPPFLMVLPLQPEPLFRGSDGGPGSYETEFLEGLIPYIEELYRSNPAKRAIAGISRGGVWALEIALRNPLRFNAVAALSPALAVNSAREPYDPFEIAASAERFPMNILLLAGDEDWARVETERLSSVLSDKNVEHMLQIVAGDHSNETWKSPMEDVLSFLTQGSGRQ